MDGGMRGVREGVGAHHEANLQQLPHLLLCAGQVASSSACDVCGGLLGLRGQGRCQWEGAVTNAGPWVLDVGSGDGCSQGCRGPH
jgi:hypothetical protein